LVEPFAVISVDCHGNYSTFSPEFLGQKSDYYNTFIIGNLVNGNLRDSLGSESFKRLSRDVAAGVALCRRSCEHFPVCGGGSPVNKFFENGMIASSETMFRRLSVKIMAILAMEIIENTTRELPTTKALSVDNGAKIDLYVLGTGVALPEQLTTQTIEVLYRLLQVVSAIAPDDVDRVRGSRHP